MALLFGAVADDFTGATDLCNTLVINGLPTAQLIGVPAADFAAPEAEALVVSLKSRTAPVATAVADSLAALAWLRKEGARQYMFKYCSTFDSTDKGNIGPVAEAMLQALATDFTIFCTSFPAAKRSIYLGHLFVGDVLLSESGMRNHPLTPMTDANLVRVLQRQSKARVGLVPYDIVERGADAIAASFARLRQQGTALAIVDALTERHLRDIGAAAAGLQLVTGGSGIAMGLPDNFRRAGLSRAGESASLPRAGGHAAVIAGSCSDATLGQIERMRAHSPAFELDPLTASSEELAAAAIAWALPKLAAGPVLIYASAPPARVAEIQAKLGRARAGELIERANAQIARGLVAAGVRRLVIAGGETSGAAVAALGVRGLKIGPEIDPGVPWTQALFAGHAGPREPMFLALKSGNFGGPDFFRKAFEKLAG
jgi:3-dehydrotetronate 4-kinase